MYGGSKLGRGGGRGGGGVHKRNSFPTPPPQRLSAPSASNRLSRGSSSVHRNRTSGPGGGTSAGVEETFSLESGNNPLAFAMIIRLVPDLVEEIRRVESEGGTARIKFDSMANNPNGNVIDVGGKEFRFTWSRETGDLCDIYEERQSGEDGSGLLVESGCAWRKLNVQRVLDESTTKQVKMRSVEAERKQKARRAIRLDHANPPLKSQVQQLASVETNQWKQFKQKKEPPFKKRKMEPLQASGPPKSTFKPGVGSAAALKARRSASPIPSSHGQSGAQASPGGPGNNVKSRPNIEEINPVQVKAKEDASNPVKNNPMRVNNAVQDTQGSKGSFGAKPIDLRTELVTLLTENPKGMSLKALEKATGDMSPSFAKKIEPILKSIAILQTPGRYFLKPAVELDSCSKPSPESGSSPEYNRHQTSTPEDIHELTSVPGPKSLEKVHTGETGEQARLYSKLGEESMSAGNIDIQQHSPDLFAEKKVSDNSEVQAASSSESGTDSESESNSSDSGSDSGSHSRSKSRSPRGSGSGSTSDSDSDASSNSKMGSDEDVDIMTSDDDNESKRKLQASEPRLSTSPITWGIDDGKPVHMDEKHDDDGSDAVDIEGHGSDVVDIGGRGSDAVDVEGHESDAIDIVKNFNSGEHDIEMAENTSYIHGEDAEKPMEGARTLTHLDDRQEREKFIGNLFEDKETTVTNCFRQEHSDSSERVSKRGFDMEYIDERPERTKRSKVENLRLPPVSGDGDGDTQFHERPHNISPNRIIEDHHSDLATQTISGAGGDMDADIRLQMGQNPCSGNPNSDYQKPGRKSLDQSTPSKGHNTVERHNKHGRKFSEKSKGFPVQREKGSKDGPKDDFAKKKKGARNYDHAAGIKNYMPFDHNYGKYGEMANGTRNISTSHMGNGRGSILQRELSDLELGELREPLPEEPPVMQQFERKGSFKLSENRPSTSDNCNSDISKGKHIGKGTLDARKSSSLNLNVGVRRTPEHHIEDSTRTDHKVSLSQSQYLSRVDNAEGGQQLNKDGKDKSRGIETGLRLSGSAEGYGESHRKAPAAAPKQLDPKRGLASSVKENKAQTISNSQVELLNGRKDNILMESNGSDRKRMESSSSDDTCTYSKYEKDEPELKGPIKDISQYKEYVQEYRDKYESYLRLNKILESYRNKFQKLGKDMEFAKGRDVERYHELLGQLKDSYHQCGTRHKRLKKIFVVLHEELKHLKQRMKDYAALSCTKD